MDISNMLWNRVAYILANNDYEGCKELFLTLFAMEYPFNAQEHEDMGREKREDIAYEKVLATFKERCDRLARNAYPVIKNVFENKGHQYENILVPLTDGRRTYQISVPLKEAYETEGKNIVTAFEKAILLHTIDEAWKENLRALDELQHSVQNASYEQKDPLLIFKLESVTLFDNMINEINDGTVSVLMRVNLPMQQPEDVRQAPAQMPRQRQNTTEHKQNLDELSETQKAMQQAAANAGTQGGAQAGQTRRPMVNTGPKVGRNDPCPCGSGKKYKACHGKGLPA
jgi:preprotein translocase subunit SecA